MLVITVLAKTRRRGRKQHIVASSSEFAGSTHSARHIGDLIQKNVPCATGGLEGFAEQAQKLSSARGKTEDVARLRDQHLVHERLVVNSAVLTSHNPDHP